MKNPLLKDPLRKRLAITSVITIVAGQIISFVVVLSSVNCISGGPANNGISCSNQKLDFLHLITRTIVWLTILALTLMALILISWFVDKNKTDSK